MSRSCAESFAAYGLRAFGRDWGAPLPRGLDITLCDQIALIGSGALWNLYFTVFALAAGFVLAIGLALARASGRWMLRAPAVGFIFFFRGSPLFIQFFFAYQLFILLPRTGFEIEFGFITIGAQTGWLTRAWAGALIVLWLNTAAYSAEIFHGALMSVPKGDLEAADAYGMTPAQRFRRVVFPTMLRLGWPAYTNEAIFLFHATALVFLSGFPVWQQSGDALYYARYFASQTFNPFVSYPIAAGYFVLGTLAIIAVFGLVQRRLNRHLPVTARPRLRIRPQYVR